MSFADLQRQPFRYDFYRAMRLVECAFPDRPRLGRSLRPGDDAIRLGQQPAMAFPAGALAAFAPDRRGVHQGTLRVFMFGLLGPNGPLPLHLTEYVLDRVRSRPPDHTLVSFLDVFHHRLLSLFWRAHADAEPTVELDRGPGGRFARYFGALAGLGSAATDAGDARIDRTRRHWIGHLSRAVRNADGLQAQIAGFFRMLVRVEEFVGQWLPMPGSERCRLGAVAGAALGRNAFLGESLWDCSQTLRLCCGPLDLQRYERLLPGGDSWTRLAAIVRTYLGHELGWEVRLVLRHAEVPPLLLGRGTRLGWTTWLGPPPAARDPDDLLLQPERQYRHQASPRATSAAPPPSPRNEP